MRKLVLIVFAALSIMTGCSKTELEVNSETILGKWTETYDDYPYFMQDGYVEWTFRSDGEVDIHVYDVFAGDFNVRTSFKLKEVEGKTIISIEMGAEDSFIYPDYRITKLTKNEMYWQLVGTEFTPGTVGSNFRHFTRN